MTSRWMPGHERLDHPATWVEHDGLLYCLACRRARAGEAGALGAPADASNADRVRLRAAALVDFEIQRAPDRNNGAIARALHTSVPAVVKARRRLEAGSER